VIEEKRTREKDKIEETHGDAAVIKMLHCANHRITV